MLFLDVSRMHKLIFLRVPNYLLIFLHLSLTYNRANCEMSWKMFDIEIKMSLVTFQMDISPNSVQDHQVILS